MRDKRANRDPYWRRRVGEVQKAEQDGDSVAAAAAAVGVQWDLVRTYISKRPLAKDRGAQWVALAEDIVEFNTRFTGAPEPNLLGTEVLDGEGRNTDLERRVKAATSAVYAAYGAYDTARKYLRRIDDAAEQATNWRDLEAALREFIERFGTDPTRAVARMATANTRHN